MAEGENVGGIYIEIEADVAKLLTGQQQANQALDDIGGHAQKTATQLNKLDTQVSATAKGVSGALRTGFQQAGYQIQDFIIQVQGGQSALVALSQQGTQLLGVFGAGGAVAGALLTIGTVIVGSLIASMDNATVSTKALEDAQKRLSDIFQVSANGVVVLSDKFSKLAETSENAARAQLTMALIDAQNIIKSSVQSVNELGDALGTWKAPLSAAISQLDALKARGSDVNQALKNLGGTYEGNIVGLNQLNQVVNELSKAFGVSSEDAVKLVQALADVRHNANPETIAELRDITVDLSQKYGYANKSLSEFTGKIGEYSLRSDQAAESTRLATEMLQGHKVASEADAEAIVQNTQRLQAYIQMIKDEGATIAMTARQKALYRAEQLGASDEDKKAINTSFDKIDAFKAEKAAQKEAEKESRKSASSAASDAKKVATQQESAAQKLANLKRQAELSANSTQELSRESAMLRAEQSLGKSATADQIQQARTYAAAIWDTAAALKARNAVPELKESADYTAQKSQLEMLKEAKDAQGNLLISQEQYNQASEQLEQQHQINLAKIRAGQVVTPQQQAQGEVDPVQRLANQHAQELALIQQFETQKGQLTANGIALMNAANTQYEKARIDAQWEIFRNQSTTNELMASAVDGFASQAASSMTGLIDGTQSATEAFQNLGSAIVNSVIQALVEVGVQYLKNAAMAMIADKMTSNSSQQAGAQTAAAWAPAAAAASIATFGGAAIAGIAGMVAAFAIGAALAGKRKNGGPVSAGSMYQVGEGGMPEIYRASNGSQYMIPGDNGSVISNKDLQGSGGAVQVITNVYNYSSGVDVKTHSNQNGSEMITDIFITDLDSNGPMTMGMISKFGLSTKANGAF
ncbi:phage tail length tape measure family protein [Klebsiella aerogenes]